MRALGIDPSLSSCGWAVHDGRHVVAAGVRRCPAVPNPTVKGVEAAYSGAIASWMRQWVAQTIAEHGVGGVCIEEPIPAMGRFQNTGGRAIHTAAVLFSAAACAAVESDVRVWGVPQQTWRKGVGVPPAPRGVRHDVKTAHNKRQAVWRCQQEGYRPRNHDEAEAVLIALWLASQLGAARGADAAPLFSEARK